LREALFQATKLTSIVSFWLRKAFMDSSNYLWRSAYVSAVLEKDPSLVSERILEALMAISRRFKTPILINGPEHTAIKAAQRGLAALNAQRIEGQSDFRIPLVWNPANRN
jgi:hypothetical protein